LKEILIIQLLIILGLLVRSRALQLRVKYLREYISVGAPPTYSKVSKNVVGSVSDFKSDYKVYIKVKNVNTTIVITSKSLYLKTIVGDIVDLLETTVIESTSGAIIERSYEAL
jgi:hypothetical protein